MSRELENLKKISDFFKKSNAKIKLIKLLRKAKLEYDRYDYQSSLESLNEAYKLNPENPAVLRGLGCINQFNQNYEQAVEYYLQASRYSTAKEVEYTLIGMAYYLQDRLDEAIEYFNYAIDENDNYDKAYEGRNQAMLENHLKIIDLQEALKKYF